MSNYHLAYEARQEEDCPAYNREQFREVLDYAQKNGCYHTLLRYQCHDTISLNAVILWLWWMRLHAGVKVHRCLIPAE